MKHITLFWIGVAVVVVFVGVLGGRLAVLTAEWQANGLQPSRSMIISVPSGREVTSDMEAQQIPVPKK